MTVQELLNAAQKLSLSEQVHLASQLIQGVAEQMKTTTPEEITPPPASQDPLIGLFAGSPNLATQAKEILAQVL